MQMLQSLLVVSYLALQFVHEVSCLEPIITTGVLGGLGAAALGIYKTSFCHFRECCTTPWIQHNVTSFEKSFDEFVFGQHLVRDVVSKALKSHLRRIHSSQDGPKKALVLSFHGLSGSGKNYVTKFIAESLFSEGMKSRFVHHIIGPHHLPKSQHADIHALHVQDWVKTNVSACGQSLFIFDEVDKIDAKILNGIKPFIDTHEVIDNVDYRKSIFVLLSNTGSKYILEKVMDMWTKGVKREDIVLSDLEHVTEVGAFNEAGGLHKSELVLHHLVDHFVPFLPLERSHVQNCATVDLINALLSENIECEDVGDMVQQIVSKMVFKPDDTKLYSATGCKRVSFYVGDAVETLIDKLDSGEAGLRCKRIKTDK